MPSAVEGASGGNGMVRCSGAREDDGTVEAGAEPAWRMNRLRDRKVLVHCQVNMRASSMTFLYRVIVGGEKPDAYEAVAKVWSPEGPWKRLLTDQLRKAGIAFEPY